MTRRNSLGEVLGPAEYDPRSYDSRQVEPRRAPLTYAVMSSELVLLDDGTWAEYAYARERGWTVCVRASLVAAWRVARRFHGLGAVVVPIA